MIQTLGLVGRSDRVLVEESWIRQTSSDQLTVVRLMGVKASDDA